MAKAYVGTARLEQTGSDLPGVACRAKGCFSREVATARSLAPPRRGRFRLLALGDFLRAELRDASDQLHGDGLGEGEPDRALANLVRCKVVLERFDDALGGGVERVVLLR